MSSDDALSVPGGALPIEPPPEGEVPASNAFSDTDEWSLDPSLAFLEGSMGAVFAIHVRSGERASVGTGVLIDDHVIATNAHVVELAATTFGQIDVSRMQVRHHRSQSAIPVRRGVTVEPLWRRPFDHPRPDRDIALLVLEEPGGRRPIDRATSPALAGERVWSLGYGNDSRRPEVTSGEVRHSDQADYLAHTAATGSGDSGGPIVDAAGQLVGLNCQVVVSTDDRIRVDENYGVAAASVYEMFSALIDAGFLNDRNDDWFWTWLRGRSDSGDTDAMFKLALRYAMVGDHDACGRIAARAASAGHAGATSLLADLAVARGEHGDAVMWLRHTAEVDVVALDDGRVFAGEFGGRALVRLGIFALDAQDRVSAREYLEQAERAGVSTASFLLGKMAEEDGNPDGAAKHYARGAERGDPSSMVELGRLADQGGDITAARSWYTRAYSLGSEEAANRIGELAEMYPDDSVAERWYRSAAAAGDAVANFNLGRLALGRARVVIHERADLLMVHDRAAAARLHDEAVQLLSESRGWFQRALDLGLSAAGDAIAAVEQERNQLGSAANSS